MKKILLITLLIALVTEVQANDHTSKEIIIDDTTTEIELELNRDSVHCLVGDYGRSSLKIVVPQIKDLTFLDHTSQGAPGPCINAGICKTKPEDVWFGGGDDYRFPVLIDPATPNEKVNLRVIKKEVATIVEKECVRNYVEVVAATIRGIYFAHQAQLPLATLPLSECK